MYYTAKKFERAGLLSEGVRAGIIDPSVIRWLKIYETWRALRREHKKYEAVMITSIRHNISVQMVYRIIGIMS